MEDDKVRRHSMILWYTVFCLLPKLSVTYCQRTHDIMTDSFYLLGLLEAKYSVVVVFVSLISIAHKSIMAFPLKFFSLHFKSLLIITFHNLHL